MLSRNLNNHRWRVGDDDDDDNDDDDGEEDPDDDDDDDDDDDEDDADDADDDDYVDDDVAEDLHQKVSQKTYVDFLQEDWRAHQSVSHCAAWLAEPNMAPVPLCNKNSIYKSVSHLAYRRNLETPQRQRVPLLPSPVPLPPSPLLFAFHLPFDLPFSKARRSMVVHFGSSLEERALAF